MKTIVSLSRWLALAAVLAAVLYGFSLVNAFRAGRGAAPDASLLAAEPTAQTTQTEPTQQPAPSSTLATANPPTATLARPEWASFSYDSTEGKLRPAASNPPPPPPSPVRYTVGYPAGWTASTTTDTAADFGQVEFHPPKGKSVIFVSAVFLRPGGYTLEDMVSNDSSYLDNPARDSITVPAGNAIRLSGIMNDSNRPEDVGKSWQVVYLKQGSVVYRLFLLQASGEDLGDVFSRLLETLKPAAG